MASSSTPRRADSYWQLPLMECGEKHKTTTEDLWVHTFDHVSKHSLVKSLDFCYCLQQDQRERLSSPSLLAESDSRLLGVFSNILQECARNMTNFLTESEKLMVLNSKHCFVLVWLNYTRKKLLWNSASNIALVFKARLHGSWLLIVC